MRRRFVVGHEIGHAILPAHKQTFAYIDDFTCLPPVARNLFEREANQAAVEILFQGGQATEEFDSSPPSLDQVCYLSTAFGASIVATARYVVETSRRPVAVAVAHKRTNGGLARTHLYVSSTFAALYDETSDAFRSQVREALRTSFGGQSETCMITNRRGDAGAALVEKMFTGYTAIALVVPDTKSGVIARGLRVATAAVRVPR
jgi:IrrE N-terminal-like domain